MSQLKGRASLCVASLTAGVLLPLSCQAQLAMAVPDAGENAVLARSVGRLPSRQVVQFVARNAEPSTYSSRARSDLANLTARAAIEAKCGSVQPGYAEELARVNGLTLDNLEQPLGEQVFAIEWPACLYVQDLQKPGIFASYIVQPNDTLTGIRGRFTGDVTFDRQALDEFFAASPIKSANAKQLQPGLRIAIPFTTAATLLKPKGSSSEFLAQLAMVGENKIESALSPPAPGNIIGPVRFGAGIAGSTQNTFESCHAGDDSEAYPFDAAEVQDAYRATLQDAPNSQSPVSVVVADNGFFGAHCSADGVCPEIVDDRVRDSERFPNGYFDFARFRTQQGYGPKLASTDIEPLNFWNRKTSQGPLFGPADIDEETGHGTHVAGLTLGGPMFLPYRASFAGSDGKPWLRLIIANLSGGSPKLRQGSDQNLIFLLQPVVGFKIVNMSVAFLASTNPQIPTIIGAALQDERESLFVVAAGNAGANLAGDKYEWYPARFGGTVRSNVITVAAVDGPSNGIQRLSSFSNRSKEYVDLAAPGCALSSWVDAARPPIDISGTSQAAPLVTFTLTLLRSLWIASPLELKNRALYSGDLLDDELDRSVVRSMSQLNTAKALTYLWDRVAYVKDGRRETSFGNLSALQGLVCDSTGDAVDPANLKSLKSAPNGRKAIFTVDSSQRFHQCWGRIEPTARATLHATRQLRDGRIVGIAPTHIELLAGEIEEIIKAR